MKPASTLTRLIAVPALAAGVLFFGATTPPAAYATGNTIEAKSLSGYSCNESEWHFVINGLDDTSKAPASIKVTFTNNTSVDVALEKVSGKVAHYTLKSHLTLKVKSATAVINTGYNNFNLSHGPCNPAEQIPFVPAAALYPAIGAATFGASYGIRRLRQSRQGK
jgi:hypothetical protein